MNATFTIFRTFPALEQAKELEKLLNENDIRTVLANNIASVDLTFSTLEHQYEIRISQLDFKKAEAVLEALAEDWLNEVDQDHYLFGFSNEELYEILIQPDQWNEFDYKLAQKILEDRGKSIDKEILKALKKERLKILSKPEGNQKPWIIAGYTCAFLGGFLGIIIGYSLWKSKKTLPDGQKVYSYSREDRAHGFNIFIIGMLFFPVFITLRLLTEVHKYW